MDCKCLIRHKIISKNTTYSDSFTKLKKIAKNLKLQI